MVDKSKIAILTSVANFELYQKSSTLFPKGIQKYVIDGTNGMYGIDSIVYMMKKLKNQRVEWLIMADEDVIFKEANSVFSIIEEMVKNKITVAGVRDGGVINHRYYSPYAINTFFSIINLKDILAIWNKKEVLRHQYVKEGAFCDDLTSLEFEYDVTSVYEPYYCFYFWLRRLGKKFLFLEATIDVDNITNTVLYKGNVILNHTWYARAYGNNKKHTQRIDRHLGHINAAGSDNFYKPPIIFKHKTYYIVTRIQKIYRLILMKLNA